LLLSDQTRFDGKITDSNFAGNQSAFAICQDQAMEERVSIRGFTSEDYDQVVALWRESGLTVKPSDTLQELKKLLALAGNAFLVAELNRGDKPAEIVGTIIGAWDGRRAWIYHLAVKPLARRTRIGSELITTIERILRAQGATKINLLVEPGNRDAADFYRALGYSGQPLQFFSKTFES
jgi:ribosomal protein S18 acetylase RimI-like enzyme